MKRLMQILKRSLYWDQLKLCVVKITHSTEYHIPYEHYHPNFYELVIVYNGSGIHLFDGRELPIQAGNVFLVPPRMRHCYAKPAPLSIYNILFGEDVLPSFWNDLMGLPGFQLLFNTSSIMRNMGEILHIEPQYFPDAVKVIEEMEYFQGIIQPGARTMLFSNFLRLLYLLALNCQINEKRKGVSYAPRISHLLTLLSSRYGEAWTLKKMLAATNMSASSFCHQFKQITGKSPIDYLLKLRLQNAASLLMLQELSITEIASRCGFSDSNYFSRQFKKMFSRSPQQFRLHNGSHTVSENSAPWG